VQRIPLVTGSRLVVAAAPDEALVLRPPPPGRATDAEAATLEALRFPLAGESLESLARGASRATIVVQSPALPVQSPNGDPRPRVIAAVSHVLETLGIPTSGQTLLIACGLARRASQRDVTALVTPEFARRFHGSVVVHDASDPALVPIDETEEPAIRVAPSLVETDLVVVVSAAETVLHGGPATLLAAANAEAQRHATADSLLETSGSEGWLLATRLERALTERVPVFGVSLLLNHPRTTGVLRGYPYDAATVERIASRSFRVAVSATPDPVRRRVLRSLRAERTTAAALAGPPSVAHTEALLRGIELKHAALPTPLDALVLAVPGSAPLLPRERPNPLTVTHAALAHSLALWRDAFPVAEGGVVILVDPFRRTFSRPTQLPYLAFFGQTPIARNEALVAEAEAAVARDARALDDYRAGRTVHPLLPFRDWDACRPALERLGAVYVAGARDATAVRQLGFVPMGSVGAALQMARGQQGPFARVGFLLAPPYFPLKVGVP
jgi:Lactate racemase N-terminal domain